MPKIAVLVCWVLLWQVPALGAETLTIPGTGACETVLRDLAEVFNAQNPGQTVTVPPSSGTRGGLRNLLDDKAELARIVAPLGNQKIDPKIQYRTFARDAVVFVVQAQLGVENLTLTQLTEIFAGKITNWRDVGGPPGLIRVIVRDPGDSILQCIQFYLTAFQAIHFAPDRKIAYHDAEMVDLLKKYRHGIGISSSSCIYQESSLRALAIDGVSPNAANLKSGGYPAAINYALAFKQGSLSKLAQNFMDFVLSEQAQAVLQPYGLISPELK